VDIIQLAKPCKTLHGQIKIGIVEGGLLYYGENHYFALQNFLLISFNIAMNQNAPDTAFLRKSRSFKRFYLKRHLCSFLFITHALLPVI